MPLQLIARLKAKSAETGYSVSELVRKAVEAFLK